MARYKGDWSMNKKIAKLKKILNEVCDINSAIAVLGWDQQTYMPQGGAEERAGALGTLSELSHIKFTAAETGKILDSLDHELKNLDPDSDDACLIKVARREYNKKTKVPAPFVAEMAETSAIAQHVWEKARETSDFKIFAPHLEKIFEQKKRYAGFFGPYEHVYDPLLDDYEPGMKISDVKAIFEKVKPAQVELIKKISCSKQVDNSFLFKNYDEKKQWDFGVKVLNSFGYDWNRGRQDKTIHPFTTTFGLGDVRITTRIHLNNIGSGLFSSMHEGGHAIYEQGINMGLRRTPLATGASLAVHESQSRLWENLVGRSAGFWTFFYPMLQKEFPEQLGNVSFEAFYKGINRVEPSLVRVEADEATYNLHVMLRLEIETGIMEDKIKVIDLPEIWNTKMHEYLGVTPENDAEGVLQDVHWSCGLVGYFPTYALGNMISAQLWDCINKDIPSLNEEIRNGNFTNLRLWLKEKLHRHGSKFQPADLVKRITGTNINPEPYIRYLNKKYGAIYGF